jgi:hypothetical protein
MARFKSKAVRKTTSLSQCIRQIKNPPVKTRLHLKKQVARKVAAGFPKNKSLKFRPRSRPGVKALKEIRKYQDNVGR